MKKRAVACALSVVCIVCSTYNKFNVYAQNVENVGEGRDIILEYIDYENEYKEVFYKSNIEFEDTYKEDLADCKGIKVDYYDLILLNSDNVNEIVEDGAILVVDIETKDEITYLINEYQKNVDYVSEVTMEKLESVYFSNYGGETIMGYIGSGILDSDDSEATEEVTDSNETDIESFIKTLQTIEDEENFAIETKMGELGIDYEKESGLAFQIPALNTVLKPVSANTNLYVNTMFNKSFACQISLTAYCYKGTVWDAGGKKTYYNYILSSAQVAPEDWIAVSNYTARIGSNSINTSILEAAYIDDNEKSSTYSLSGGASLDIGKDIKASVSVNPSISNTYSTSTMDVIEKFSHMKDTSYPYCDWYVIPSDKEAKGQSRKIEPAIVTKSTVYTNGKVSIRNVQLVNKWKDFGINQYTYYNSSEIVNELTVSFK